MKKLLALLAAAAMFAGVSHATEVVTVSAEAEVVKCDATVEGSECPVVTTDAK
jgi:uncharacterized lipoprotein YajG